MGYKITSRPWFRGYTARFYWDLEGIWGALGATEERSVVDESGIAKG